MPIRFQCSNALWVARHAPYTSRTGRQDTGSWSTRVPPTGPVTRAIRLTLRIMIHEGDHGETVATIAHPQATRAGRFHLADASGHPSGRVHPIVTADTLDTNLRRRRPASRASAV